ncbi:MAG: rod shape-determining protein RodA [Chlamydiae bacterium SM23_39]|nr:MAG: rod shape-determining protein RodA [Chlamydiae bacterium SM23_39]
MWNHKYLLRIDYKLVFVLTLLMVISFLVISSMTGTKEDIFFTFFVKRQMTAFFLGWIAFFFFAGWDYRKLKEFSFLLYLVMVFFLLGIYFIEPIHKVHRWYRLPFLNVSFQPSEYTKLIIIVCLGWFLEKNRENILSFKSSSKILIISGIPFFLILNQPDLGTALILYPITLVMCYFGDINKKLLRVFLVFGLIFFSVIFLMFIGIFSHNKMRPFFSPFFKEYQYERLNPNTYHHKSVQISIAIGGLVGTGWKKGEFASKRWLPASYTDSIFAAYAEEFGFLGIVFLLFLFYFIIHSSLKVVRVTKDYFGKLLASGIAVYFIMHIIINIAMMCGFLPISGVPLIFITYGGSSVVTAMVAMGILQNIYARRFMF